MQGADTKQIPHEGPSRRPSNQKKAKMGSALIFAAVYVAIPWPSIWLRVNGTKMVDREAYIQQIENSRLTIDYREYEVFTDFITYEFLWSWLLRSLHDVGFSAETILNAVGFIYILTSSLMILQRLPWPFLLLLINPLVIGLAFSQSRIALMASVLFLAHLFYSNNRLVSLLLAIISFFVHTSAPLFIILYIIPVMSSRNGREKKSPLWPILAGVIVGLLSGPLMSYILNYFNDRRAEYNYDVSSGFLFLSFWAVCFFYLLIRWEHYRSDNYSRIAIALFALATISIFLDSYASRFLAVLFPVTIISLGKDYSDNKRFSLIFMALVFYIILLWVYALLT